MTPRVVALFTVYAGLAFLGTEVAGLLAGEPAPELDDCAFTVERELTIPAAGLSAVDIDAGSGELQVEGRDDFDEIVVVGHVCASEEAFIDQLTVRADASGSAARIETRYPDVRGGVGSRTARIDLEVLVPRGLDVEIDDSSGGIDVRGAGAVRIDDSSGSIDVSDVDGPVEIDDSSGGIELMDVRGDVRIEDGSGGIELRSVTGGVTVRDGSGGIDIEGVGSDVVVDRDGSGSIEVRGVGGDLVVRRDGSGGIRYSGVRGSVDIPVRKRRDG